MVWPILGWQMLSKAPPISLIHQRKDMDHFISNGCLSLQHSTPFSMLRGYPKSSILCAIWVSTLADIALSDPWVALTCFWKLLPSTLFIKGRLWTISAAMNVSHCSTSSNFPVLRRYLKSDLFCAIWESTFRYITRCDPYLADRCFQTLLPSPLYIKGRIWTTSSAMDVFPYSIAPHFNAERVPQI